ncbi:MAG TPA: L,D-transpeptidase [Chromatiales bacterium]|nr:L,D-transpeptidase [Chromatiales bacterium]
MTVAPRERLAQARRGGLRWLDVDIDRQELRLMAGVQVLQSFPVSTALNGPGERRGSECTPRGLHRIRLRIGEGRPPNTVFVARRPTGEIYHPELARREADRDWILTRILWLTGLEPGRNRGGEVDSLRRFIYIHGTPDEVPMGQPASHGCIRMRNADIIALFDQVANGMLVDIREGSND